MKDRSETSFSTIAVLLAGGAGQGTFQLKMKIKGQTYILPKEAELRFNRHQAAFFVVAAH